MKMVLLAIDLALRSYTLATTNHVPNKNFSATRLSLQDIDPENLLQNDRDIYHLIVSGLEQHDYVLRRPSYA